MDEHDLLHRMVTAEAELINLRLALADEQALTHALRLQLRVARATRGYLIEVYTPAEPPPLPIPLQRQLDENTRRRRLAETARTMRSRPGRSTP